MDADTRLAEIAESHPGDWYSGEWRTEYVDSTSDEPSYYVVKHQESGTILAELPDWAGPIALFIADAHDAVPVLLARVSDLEATLERYVGKEPTVAEEMAYLNRCLTAVHAVCTLAEKQATRWEHPLPVPEWVAEVREAAGPENRIEDEVAKLRSLLADRDREIAELRAAEPTLDDDQPGAPR